MYLDCKTSAMGREYSGDLAVSENGLTCTNWAESAGDLHNFTGNCTSPKNVLMDEIAGDM